MSSTSRARGSHEREFKFTRKNFETLASLMRARTGIVLKDHKIDMVYGRLARRLRELKLKTFDDYINYAQGPDGTKEFTELMNALTTNLTRFFREDHQITHFVETALKNRTKLTDDILVWSAGCSTGQEPYSLALATAGAWSPTTLARLKILATDIDTRVLATAERGLYPLSKLEEVPPRLHKFTTTEKEVFGVSQALRNRIFFRVLNLMGPWPHRKQYDAIFCRNVLIYFDKPTQKTLISRYVNLLKPGGRLYLGHSESLAGEGHGLTTLGRSIFEKPRTAHAGAGHAA